MIVRTFFVGSIQFHPELPRVNGTLKEDGHFESLPISLKKVYAINQQT